MYHRHFPHFHPPQGRTVCARRLAENDVMEYIAKPNMRDDASSPANRVRFVTNFIICNKAKVRRDEGIPPYCAQTNALLFICPSKALGTPSPTLGKAHRPFLLFAPGGFRRGRVTPPYQPFYGFPPIIKCSVGNGLDRSESLQRYSISKSNYFVYSLSHQPKNFHSGHISQKTASGVLPKAVFK